jgi:tRNA pseudouridine synthase 10
LRGIPQTRWPCGNCGGKGCKECDFTGKQYKSSVEELISPPFIEAAKAKDSKFHGAGREDIDVKMLGTGRPFILELMNPKIRSLNLEQLKKEVNERNKGKIEVSDLRISNKQEVITIKEGAEFTKKVYKALVKAENPIDKKQFKEKVQKIKEILLEEKIEQRTPHRVSHRRADKIRKKKIFEVKGEYLDSSLFEFIIKTQGGTYIKELISGDEGRTKPSFSSIFNQDLVCTKLDVMEIIYNSMTSSFDPSINR